MREAAECLETFDFANLKVDNNGVGAMLRQAADAMEREEKREKDYEYAVKWLYDNSVTNNMGVYRKWAESIVRDVGASKVRLVRRQVGEWEDVRDGE